jgi:capsular exopolysaccharide synthesis family protein
MSKTWEAVAKAEAERAANVAQTESPGGDGGNGGNGHSNGKNGKNGKNGNGKNGKNGHAVDLARLDPRIEEEYQKLRGSIFFRPGKESLRNVMVVAGAHGEGATTTSSILGTLLAKSEVGRVALVDANVRTPSLHDVFSLPDTTRGLTDLVMNGFPPRQLAQPTSIPNLFVVPAGRPLPSPSVLYERAIAALLADLQDEFRYVLIDCSPVTDYSDALFLAPKVDGVVIVVRAEQTKIEAALGMKRQLEQAGGQVIGTVLNGKRSYIPLMLQRFL